jgi:hypothetical protein
MEAAIIERELHDEPFSTEEGDNVSLFTPLPAQQKQAPGHCKFCLQLNSFGALDQIS